MYDSAFQSGARSGNAYRGKPAGQRAAAGLADTPRFSRHSYLSPRDSDILSTVTRFRQVSASQIRRLHFTEGSFEGKRVRQERACRRLVKWGVISRLPRPIGGGISGSAEYIYIPAGSRTRIADPHTLDITELYCRLSEQQNHFRDAANMVQLLVFLPEPYCHAQVGQIELKPDAFVDIRTPKGRTQYHIEVDRGSEFRPQLKAKMTNYNKAAYYWTEGNPPLVVFVVPDEVRKRFVESVVVKMSLPDQFRVCLFEDAIKTLAN